MKRGSFLITFRQVGFRDDHMIELPSRWKLLWWMITTGIWCRDMWITFIREDEDEA